MPLPTIKKENELIFEHLILSKIGNDEIREIKVILILVIVILLIVIYLTVLLI